MVSIRLSLIYSLVGELVLIPRGKYSQSIDCLFGYDLSVMKGKKFFYNLVRNNERNKAYLRMEMYLQGGGFHLEP